MSGQPLQIIPRMATTADAEAIAALINRTFKVEEWFVDGDRTSAAEVRRLMNVPGSRFLLADESGGRMVACVYTERRSPTVGYIGLLAVDDDCQGRGLGPALMECAERRLAEIGCTAAEISVVDLRAELFPLYEKLGYRANGTLPFPRVSKRPCCLVRMTKALQ